jgi:hypothetical protein
MGLPRLSADAYCAYWGCEMCDSEQLALTDKLDRLTAENQLLHRAVGELMADIVSLARQRGVALALPASWLPEDDDNDGSAACIA